MGLNGLNAAAAAVILDRAGVDADTKTRGVVIAAFVPGLLGLAVPLAMAQNKSSSDGRERVPQLVPKDVVVPDVTTRDVDSAASRLKVFRLVAVSETTFSDDNAKGVVIHQSPPAGELVPLDSEVTIFVGTGQPPEKEVAVVDMDEDLTNKLEATKKELEDNFKTQLDATEQRIRTAITTALANGTPKLGASGEVV